MFAKQLTYFHNLYEKVCKYYKYDLTHHACKHAHARIHTNTHKSIILNIDGSNLLLTNNAGASLHSGYAEES